VNPLELAAVALVVLLAAAYLIRCGLAYRSRKSENSCGGCHCGKNFVTGVGPKKL